MPSKNPQVRAIELEASRRAAADGTTSHKERFAIRKALRADAGLGKEQKQRGGVAGVVDRNKQYALPLALAAAPFALPALGGLLGIGGGAGAAGAAGAGAALPAAIPAAAGGAGILGGIGGAIGNAAKQVGGFINSPLGQTVTQLGTAAYGIGQQNKANNLTANAIEADKARWQAGAPLRQAGSAAMLTPIARDTSSLDALARRGNPFALPAGGR